MPDFLNIFECAAKTVRHISREFRVAWVSGVEAAQRDAAEALCEKEAEEEVAEPAAWFCRLCGACDYEHVEHCNYMKCKATRVADVTEAIGEFCFGYNEYQPLPEPLPTPSEGCVCGHTQYVHVVGGCNAAYHYAVDPCVCKGFRLYSLTPAASTTAVESDLGVGPPRPTPSVLNTVTDVLAEHYLESLSDRRIVGCRCGLELGSRQQHWDHQADLIAGALKARTQAAEK